MGEMQIPDDALYGASTQRAVLNFPISGHRLPEPFIRALGLVKLACAEANADLGLLPTAKAELIRAAAREVADGKLLHRRDGIQGTALPLLSPDAEYLVASAAVRWQFGRTHQGSPLHLMNAATGRIPPPLDLGEAIPQAVAFSADNFPVFDFMRPNVYVIADSNHGFKMIGVGEQVACLLTGGRAELLEPFAFSRFEQAKALPKSNAPFPWM